MFVLVHNNHVEIGPCYWSKNKFDIVLQEDLNIEHSVPLTRTEQDGVYIVDENTKIYPVMAGQDLPYDPRIEIKNGPFWEFTDTIAIYHYEPARMDLAVAKSFLKQELADERWRKEISGIKVTIQSQEITVSTDRGQRESMTQRYFLMGDQDQVQWKFLEVWLTLSKSEMLTVVQAVSQHVQTAFDWEASVIAQIDACLTHEELLLIVIKEES